MTAGPSKQYPALCELKVELTWRCGLNCAHCSSGAGPSNAVEMRLDEYERIVREAAEMGVKKIDLSGGEPFLWDGLKTAVDHAVGLGLEATIYTSGNVPDFTSKLESLKQSGVGKLVFSIFAATPHTHDDVTRIRGSFDRTIHALNSTVSSGLEAQIHFVPMANNYKELEDICKISHESGAFCVSVLRFVPQGRGRHIKHQSLNAEQIRDLRDTIVRLRGLGYNIRTGSPFNFFMLKDQPSCHAAIDRLTIKPDLSIAPCDAFKQINLEGIIGKDDFSSLASKNLYECWEKSIFLNAVRKSLTTSFASECADCPGLKKCNSGCLAQKFLTYGDLERRRDPDCLFATSINDRL